MNSQDRVVQLKPLETEMDKSTSVMFKPIKDNNEESKEATANNRETLTKLF
jgi:hypothetical protein